MTATASTQPAGDQLPQIDPTTGFLPAGIHECSWSEFVDTFVDNAPHPVHRRRRLRALEVYLDVLDDLFPGSTVWLDGGFVSHKATPPFDIDVLAVVNPTIWNTVYADLQTEIDALNAWLQAGQAGQQPKAPTLSTYGGLLTHQDVQVPPMYFPRIQPFGGYIDSFIFPADASQVLGNFERWWSLDYATSTPKGFVEVKPDGR